MTRLISISVLKLYWAMAFAMMATACLFDLGDGVADAFRVLERAAPTDVSPVAELSGLFASACGLVAALFLWASLVEAGTPTDARRPDDVERAAFGLGAAVLVAAGVPAAVLLSDALPGIGIQMAALTASYMLLRDEPVERMGAAARSMAEAAARTYAKTSNHAVRSGEGI